MSLSPAAPSTLAASLAPTGRAAGLMPTLAAVGTLPADRGLATDRPLPGLGLPHDRHTRIAARRTFVALKHRFMAAVADVGGQRAEWLRFQVRQAQEPVDLWLLRGVVFDALRREGPVTDRTQAELSRVLDSVFPDSAEMLPYGVRS